MRSTGNTEEKQAFAHDERDDEREPRGSWRCRATTTGDDGELYACSLPREHAGPHRDVALGIGPCGEDFDVATWPICGQTAPAGMTTNLAVCARRSGHEGLCFTPEPHRARVDELERERAGLLATLDATRALLDAARTERDAVLGDLLTARSSLDAVRRGHERTREDAQWVVERYEHMLAAVRAELESATERGRELVDEAEKRADAEARSHAIAALALVDAERELVALRRAVEQDEAIIDCAAAGLDFAIGAHGPMRTRRLERLRSVLQMGKARLDARRLARAQRASDEQPNVKRKATGRRRSAARSSGESACEALFASSARNDVEAVKVPELPPPAPAPPVTSPILLEEEDARAPTSDPDGSEEVHNG